MASEQLKVPVKDLVTEGGAVFDRTNAKTHIAYARWQRGKDRASPHRPGVVKKPSEFQDHEQTPHTRMHARRSPARRKYAGDIDLPGMLYGGRSFALPRTGRNSSTLIPAKPAGWRGPA